MKTIHTIIAVVAGALFGGLVGIENVVALVLGAGAAFYAWQFATKRVKTRNKVKN